MNCALRLCGDSLSCDISYPSLARALSAKVLNEFLSLRWHELSRRGSPQLVGASKPDACRKQWNISAGLADGSLHPCDLRYCGGLRVQQSSILGNRPLSAAICFLAASHFEQPCNFCNYSSPAMLERNFLTLCHSIRGQAVLSVLHKKEERVECNVSESCRMVIGNDTQQPVRAFNLKPIMSARCFRLFFLCYC